MNRLLTIGAAAILQFGVMQAGAAVDYTTYAGYSEPTGGTGGTAVTVTTASDLETYAAKDGKYIITIKGTIDGAAIVCASNKTFIGDGTTATLTNSSFVIKSANNIIIKNITMHFPNMDESSTDDDLIHIESSKAYNIWIDHCEFYNMIGDCNGDGDTVEVGDLDDGTSDLDYYDGTCDITKGASKVTFSWNYVHDAYKTSLIGSSQVDDTTDWQVSYHHNLFNNTHSRLPSIRGGTGTVFNNYYLNCATSGVNCRSGAKVYIEGNYFNGVGDGVVDEETDLQYAQGPIGYYYDSVPGYWNVKNNTFVNCLGSQPDTSTCTYTPSFSYSGVLIATDSVPSVTEQYAGIIGKTKTLSYRDATGVISFKTINAKQNIKTNQNLKSTGIYNIRGVKVGSSSRSINKTVANGVYLTKGSNSAIVNLNTTR